jgi:hypothetical protein
MPMRFALRGSGADTRFRSKYTKLSRSVLVVFFAMTLVSCDNTRRDDLKRSHAGVATGLRSGRPVLALEKLPASRAFRVATGPRSRTPIPLPGRELLEPQPEFKCELGTTEPKTDELRKLNYERQCYRHAELILRARLDRLQRSVTETIKAIKRRERSDL